MTGFIADGQSMENPLEPATQGYLETPPTEEERFGAMFGQTSITQMLWRKAQRDEINSRDLLEETPPPLSADEVNKQYGPVGPDGKQVKITDQPMAEDAAKLVGKAKSDELDREGILDRGSKVHSGVNNFAVGAAAFMADPINLAATFIPGVGEENVLAGMGRVGLATTGFAARTAARTVAGATMGAASQIPLSALRYGLGQQEASDYSLRDAFKDVAYGAAGGAILHAGFGAALHETGLLKPDAAMKFGTEAQSIIDSPAPTKAAAMKGSVSQIVSGRQVDPASVISGDLPLLADKQRQESETGFAPGLTGQEIAAGKEQLLPEGEKPEKSRLDQSVIDRYKKTISDEAIRLNIPLNDEDLNKAATLMAESHNPKPQVGNGEQVGSLDIGSQLKNAQTIEQKFSDKINNHYEQARTEYENIPDTDHGKVISTDSARELSEDYLADRSRSADVHEPASAFAKRYYGEKLAEAPKDGEQPEVLFMGGGTGAGKTRTVESLLGNEKNKSQLVYDTNMNKFNSAKEKIDQALAAGKKVTILYVYREPVDALVNGALKRATNQEAKFGSGRTVPLTEHASTHVGSRETIEKLEEHYRGNAHVSIQVIDNSQGKGNAKLSSLDKIPKVSSEGLHERLNDALNKEYDNGNISQRTYDGFRKQPQEVRTEPSAGGGEGAEQLHQPGTAAKPTGETAEQPNAGGTAGAGDNGSHDANQLTPEQVEIADLQSKLDLSKMTAEERADISGAAQAASSLNANYESSLKAWTDCLAGVA